MVRGKSEKFVLQPIVLVLRLKPTDCAARALSELSTAASPPLRVYSVSPSSPRARVYVLRERTGQERGKGEKQAEKFPYYGLVRFQARLN